MSVLVNSLVGSRDWTLLPLDKFNHQLNGETVHFDAAQGLLGQGACSLGAPLQFAYQSSDRSHKEEKEGAVVPQLWCCILRRLSGTGVQAVFEGAVHFPQVDPFLEYRCVPHVDPSAKPPCAPCVSL